METLGEDDWSGEIRGLCYRCEVELVSDCRWKSLQHTSFDPFHIMNLVCECVYFENNPGRALKPDSSVEDWSL